MLHGRMQPPIANGQDAIYPPRRMGICRTRQYHQYLSMGQMKPPDSTTQTINYHVGDTTKVGSLSCWRKPVWRAWTWWATLLNGSTTSTMQLIIPRALSLNPTVPIARSNYFYRVIRGGTFQDVAADIRLANRASMLGPNPNAQQGTPAYNGDYSPKVGFRCASDN